MSTNVYLRNTAMVALGVAGFTLTACASQNTSSRYGSANAYDFESGHGCAGAAACQAGHVPSNGGYIDQGYTAGPMQVSPGPVYADCSMLGANCASNTVYAEPATSYSDTMSYTAPATTYSETATYAAPVTSYTSTSSHMGETAACPSGTSIQADGTCMQTGSDYSSYSSTSTSSYTAPMHSGSTSYSTEAVMCPAGTSMQSDGTCMQGAGSSYTGTTTTYETTTGYSGYSATGSTSSDYLPIRK